MEVLVTGGAGYIGSHTCKLLHQKGYTPIVLDNISTGHEAAVRWGKLYRGDISDTTLLTKIIKENNIKAVIHFAASAYVGESYTDPKKYYYNNVSNSIIFLNALLEFKIEYIIFSSSCATYGEPDIVPILEQTEQKPINPYGHSKLIIENILTEYHRAYGLKSIGLRYFNAAGADIDGEIGEVHEPETHLIPLCLKAVTDPEFSLKIFGNDYQTKDGTCERDYIHVNDLASAHIKALEKMLNGDIHHDFFNIGTGDSYSVLEIINTIEEISKGKVKRDICDRREGDPPTLVANNHKITTQLGWAPSFSDLRTIISSAWNWHKKQTK